MRFIWFISILWLYSSCSEEIDSHTQDLVPVTFTPALSTRAADNTWTAGDKVGIYMVSKGNYALSAALSSNIQYTAASSATSTALNAVSAPIYYPASGDVHFVAYSPYVSTAATSSHTVTYTFVGQRTEALKEAKDFIFHRGTTDYNKSSLEASLNFTHKFSKINITASQGENGPSVQDLTMILTGMPESVTCNLAKLALNENDATAFTLSSSASPILALTRSSSTSTASVEAIVAPHSGTGNFDSRTFTFSIEGIKEYTYNLPADFTFESGKEYNFDFTLTKMEIILTKTTISNWNEGANITVGLPSNCYILKPGGNTVAIPVSQANNFDAQQLGENEAFTAEWLWADASNLVTVTKSTGTGYKDYIHVTSSAAGNDGNAVVVMKNTSGTILWSWHIWVTDYEPDMNEVFMDRNLGALSGERIGGLLYQWGRKDPFPGSASTIIALEPVIYTPTGSFTYAMSTSVISQLGYATLINTAQSIVWTIRNPATFAYAGSTNGWADMAVGTLVGWSQQAIIRTHNPCPKGWIIAEGRSGTSSSGASEDIGLYPQDWYKAGSYVARSYRGITASNYTNKLWTATPWATHKQYAYYLHDSNNDGNWRYGSKTHEEALALRCARAS